MHSRHIRLRLSLWYSGIFALILLGVGSGTSIFFVRGLRAEFDRTLNENFGRARRHLELQKDGSLQMHRSETASSRDFADVMPVEAWSLAGSSNGTLLYRSPAWIQFGLELPAPKGEMRSVTEAKFVDIRYRIITDRVLVAGSQFILRVADNEERVWFALGQLLKILFLICPVALGLSGLAGYWMAGKALRPVESSFEQMRRFTADASHELRTPLQAMRSIGEVALQPHQSQKQSQKHSVNQLRDVISSMLEETDRMSDLTQSLLTLSRADGGKVALQPMRTDLPKLVEDVCSFISVLAQERKQKITVHVESKTWVNLDPVIFRQAVVNLIDNAIKYSPEGAEIQVRVALDGRAGSIVEVKDYGTGIAIEHQSRVFDRFYRVDLSRSRHLGGSGLGLSIAKWAVEAHGGTIQLESQGLGHGSQFRIRIPR